MSDTPETDAARHDLTEYGPPTPCSYGDWVAADFACKLERERDEAREQNAKLRDIAEKVINFGEYRAPFLAYPGPTWEKFRAELDELKEGAK